MPRHSRPESVLVIGSGPAAPDRAAGPDSAGTQACRVLKEEGLRVTVVESDPATVITDPDLADATYLEPVTAETVEKVIAKERPDALLPTTGGRTALDIALALHESGVLTRYGVELLGTGLDTVRAGRDRRRFRRLARRGGAAPARGLTCRSPQQCLTAAQDLGYPVLVWPGHPTAGPGPRLARDRQELSALAAAALSPGTADEVLLEEALLGWKSIELELLRDRHDEAAVVCTTEHLDPITHPDGTHPTGAHPGDSIAVAPAMTLTAAQHRHLRDTATALTAGLGIAGGCTVRFALDPRTGRTATVALTPGATPSAALAARATGLPLARIATGLALGYSLRELRERTGSQPSDDHAPHPDHVVVRGPAPGGAVAIGRSFTEALNKALRSPGSGDGPFDWTGPVGDKDALVAAGAGPAAGRITRVHQAVRAGATVDELAAATGIDPWFLHRIARIEQVARLVAGERGAVLPQTLRLAKRHGLSDAQIGRLRGLSEEAVRELRRALGIRPAHPGAAASAAGFTARTRCRYSSYSSFGEAPAPAAAPVGGAGPKVIVLGGESDDVRAHTVSALAAAGYDPVLVDCGPATASSDIHGGHRVYCEPLTIEDLLEVAAAEQAAGELAGVLVHPGDGTPPGLADRLAEAGVPVLGTPLLPDIPNIPDIPDDATVVDVDALYDGTEVYLGGVMEHVEDARTRSGDSACTLPPVTLGRADLTRIREATEAAAARIGVRGLVGVRFALAAGQLHVREVRPGAGRTVPFVSKATGVPLARAAARTILGATIAELRADGTLPATGDGGALPPDTPIAVRATAPPSPEAPTTGGAMGIDAGFGAAYAKAQAAVRPRLPAKGRALVSVADRDKRAMVFPLKVLADTGFEILAIAGTADVLRRHGVPVGTVRRLGAADRILAGEFDLVVATPHGDPEGGPDDGRDLRAAATARGVPCLSTVRSLAAAVQGIEAERRGATGVRSLQAYADQRHGLRQAPLPRATASPGTPVPQPPVHRLP
ncbi:carbamoyl phosphate synthase large subunit [Kitasatospora sp. NPDC056446]|uniref:carbamoyl phosphate synthase preATP-grasp domain-containing protein n=1 Tax=Kitasatospora sp. NPDC056446 TaxID=3345819 RepID=UPI003691B334